MCHLTLYHYAQVHTSATPQPLIAEFVPTYDKHLLPALGEGELLHLLPCTSIEQ